MCLNKKDQSVFYVNDPELQRCHLFSVWGILVSLLSLMHVCVIMSSLDNRSWIWMHVLNFNRHSIGIFVQEAADAVRVSAVRTQMCVCVFKDWVDFWLTLIHWKGAFEARACIKTAII